MNEKQPHIVFGTDGWRGLLDEEMNRENVILVAQAFADYIHARSEPGPVAVGYDGRRRSREFAHVFSGVLSGNDIEVYLSDNVVPTPVLSFQTARRQCVAGVMITASHNPAPYNGIKFKSAKGSPLSTEQTRRIEQLIGHSQPASNRHHVYVKDFFTDYISLLQKRINLRIIKEAGLCVAVDSMAGAGGLLLENILSSSGIPARTIYGLPASDFKGRTAEPIEKNLKPLSDLLYEGDYSLGVATDGDADRLGVITDQGNWMNIQETILYLAEYIKKHRQLQGGLVKTLSVTDQVRKLAREGDFQITEVQVGFKYVAEKMQEMQVAFGAEESGGFGFGDHIPERDGIYSALLFMEMIAYSGHSRLSAFINERRKVWGNIHYDRVDIHFPSPDRIELLSELSRNAPATIHGAGVKQINHHYNSRGNLNSLKFRLCIQPRWLLIRVSETEPIVRIYAEAETADQVEKLLSAGKELINKK